MNKALTLSSRDLSEKIEAVLIQGDLSKLNDMERVQYHNKVCESVGLNPLTKPFEYIRLNGKLTLYAKRDATDQLRKVHGVSITITAREMIGDIYVVTARAKDKSGREDESTGAVFIKSLAGDNLANAYMKAETKAKRRVTLSICGLGLLDESEVEGVSSVEKEVNIHAQASRSFANDIKSVASDRLIKNPLKDEDDPTEFVVPMGQYKGKKLKDIPEAELAFWADNLEKAAKSGVKHAPTAQMILDKINEFMSPQPIFDENEELPDV